jgi:tRNA nucleotidyltransferase (CCA-adding enzyme)
MKAQSWYASQMPKTTPDQYMATLDLPEVYRVGGSVRDELLGRQAKDSDYMIRGTGFENIAHELTSNGAKISPLKLRGGGKQIGWRALVRGLGVLEIVVPRTEVSTGTGRHDFDIICDSELPLEQDAIRRDFTINALYRNVKTGDLVDPLGLGQDDLKKKIIRTTHSSSFRDDPLRTLRALRFVSRLPDFGLSIDTYDQMVLHSGAVTGLTQKGVSATALDELSKILMGSRPGLALDTAARSGVLTVLLPELEPMIDFDQRSRYHEKNTSEHVFDAVQAAANMHTHAPLRVRMALLFHDCGKPKMAWTDDAGLQHYYALSAEKAVELGASVFSLRSHEYWGAVMAGEALHRLNAPKDLRKDVVTLIERHMLPLHENIRPIKIRKLRAELGDSLLRDLITHRLADVLGKGGDTSDAVEVLAWIANEQQRAIDADVPTNVTQLGISGRELVDLGLQGAEIGRVQKQLLHEVLAQPKLNTNEWLVSRAKVIRHKDMH